ncbi:MAG TPA: hypothetical protein VHF69_09065, partial [Candidatus Synoicihabitans sp.]|nr:hypothetical protein [Candidatus Synoicihabitans sp.]
ADAPAYVGRVHAELLRRTDRPKEAYACLVALHARIQTLTHPLERELAMPDVVLARIRELEAELGLRPDQRYTPLTAASTADAL